MGLIMSYKLMVKQHNITGMKYLCITKRNNYEKYSGSGKNWLKHLKKYGKDFTTILLEETDDINELSSLGEYYSKLFDVVNSKCFANAIEERGYVYPENNPFILMTEEERSLIYKKRAKKIKERYDNYTEEQWQQRKQILKNAWNNKSEEEKLKHSEMIHNRWDNMTDEEKSLFCRKMSDGWTKRTDEEKIAFSKKMRDIRMNITEEERQEYGRKISEGRKNMTEEDKKIRAERCRQNYINNPEKYQYLFDKMSEERIGVGNPAAKLVEYKGVVYNKMAFEKQFGKIKLYEQDPNFKKLYEDNLVKHDILICPYCGKHSNSVGSVSAFKRWHFENCRKKGVIENEN